jgi:hypothetical protein
VEPRHLPQNSVSARLMARATKRAESLRITNKKGESLNSPFLFIKFWVGCPVTES